MEAAQRRWYILHFQGSVGGGIVTQRKTIIMTLQNAKGFSLIEVLLAMIIFSLSLFALVPLISTAVNIDRENGLNVRARAMAADVLDTLMGDAAPPYGNPSTVVDNGVVITRSWNITPAGNLDHISVSVNYTYNDQQKTFVLAAEKAR